jgi:hypothetical protein
MDEPKPTRGAEYPYPLRPDFTARLILPTNLTRAEVLRITAMLETLVIQPDTSSEGRE